MSSFLFNEIERLKRIFNNVPAGIEVYDRKGVLIDINLKGLEIFGVESSSLVLGISILENPNLPNVVLSNISTFLTLPEQDKRDFANENFRDSFSFEYSFDRVFSKKYYKTLYKKESKYISSKIECYFNDNGIFEDLIMIFLDETDRYQEQLELKKFKLMFDNISSFGKVGIMEHNIEEDTFIANEQWFENFGVLKSVKTDLEEVYKYLSMEDRLWIKSNYKSVPFERIPLNTIREKQFEVRVDGKSHWIKCVWLLFKNEYGDNVILGSSIDVTEFVEATNRAKESENLKTKFLENITHEIHTPLNVIVGFSQLLVDTEDLDEKMEYNRIITENNKILVKLINNILDYSKMEAGITKVENEYFDVSALAYDLFEVFKIQNEKCLTCNFLSNQESIIIYSDKNKIRDILNNLLNNAFKFTSEGFVELKMDDLGQEVRIGIVDSGIGIGKEQQRKIFDRFYKLNDFAQGSGLGLSIAHKLVNLMGGNLRINSELGKGSEFYFILPKKRD
ncbi:MAG: ATP-binding protein [Bacteroidales bacterium]|nr:ATP-binding protein [Bacteroidales bacterium]